MLTSFLFPKKRSIFFELFYFIFYFKKIFIFNEVKTFTVQGGTQINFFKCMNIRICAIFFIFDILDFLCNIFHF